MTHRMTSSARPARTTIIRQREDAMSGESPLLTPKEAAERLRASTPTLARWRGNGSGPLYINRNGRIFYRSSDLDEFERQKVRTKVREG